MKKFLFILAIAFNLNDAQAQFWKEAIQVVANPVGWATGEAARKITGDNTITQLLNPTPVIIDNIGPSIQKTTSLAKDAINNGDWYALTQFTHPWFIQTLTAAKTAKQLGLLKEDDCYNLARDIAIGVGVKAGIETGSPEAQSVINNWVNEFGSNVCSSTFEGNNSLNPEDVTSAKINTDGSIAINGTPQKFSDIYNYQNREVIRCTDDINGVANIIGYADGRFFTPGRTGQYVHFANLKNDPTGRFLFVFQGFFDHQWYGIGWDGTVNGPGPNGQPIIWGRCSCHL